MSLLAYLRSHNDRSVLAIELADALALDGNREAKRRKVRRIVEALHDEGHRICADCASDGGYWLARSDEEWRSYKESRRSAARFKFVAVRTMSDRSRDRRNGQAFLFPPSDGSREQWMAMA